MNPLQRMKALTAQRERGIGVGQAGAGTRMGGNLGGTVPSSPAVFPGGIPGCSVPPPMQPLAEPCSVESFCLAPMGFAFGCDLDGNIYAAADIGSPITASTPIGQEFLLYTRIGTFEISGVRIFTEPGEAAFASITSGDSDQNAIVGGKTDVACWNTDGCFCPANWGCASVTSPLRLQACSLPTATSFDPTTTVIGVRGTCWGRSQRSLYACGPNLGCG